MNVASSGHLSVGALSEGERPTSSPRFPALEQLQQQQETELEEFLALEEEVGSGRVPGLLPSSSPNPTPFITLQTTQDLEIEKAQEVRALLARNQLSIDNKTKQREQRKAEARRMRAAEILKQFTAPEITSEFFVADAAEVSTVSAKPQLQTLPTAEKSESCESNPNPKNTSATRPSVKVAQAPGGSSTIDLSYISEPVTQTRRSKSAVTVSALHASSDITTLDIRNQDQSLPAAVAFDVRPDSHRADQSSRPATSNTSHAIIETTASQKSHGSDSVGAAVSDRGNQPVPGPTSAESEQIRLQRKKDVFLQNAAKREQQRHARNAEVEAHVTVADSGVYDFPVDASGRPALPVVLDRAIAGKAAASSYAVAPQKAHRPQTQPMVPTTVMEPTVLKENKDSHVGFVDVGALAGNKPWHKKALPQQPTAAPATTTASAAAGPPMAAKVQSSKFQSTSKLSNILQVKNALSSICLAGPTMASQREQALAALEYWHSGAGALTRGHMLRELGLAPSLSDASVPAVTRQGAIHQFVLLFYHSKTMSFRGLYAVDPLGMVLIGKAAPEAGASGDKAVLTRIFGRGPKSMSDSELSAIDSFLKYETSSRSLQAMTVRSLTSTVDAIAVDPSKLRR